MQWLANGLINGLAIAALAQGFAVIFIPTRVFAVALAGFYVLTPYLAWQVREWGAPWAAGVAVAVAGVALLNLVFERTNHMVLARRGASPGVHLIASLGGYIILTQTVALIWGNETRTLRTGLSAVHDLGNMTLTNAQLVLFAASSFALIGFHVGVRRSRLGLHFRALADNPAQLALYGVDTDRLRVIAAAIAGLLVAVSSLSSAQDVGFDPHGGLSALLLGVVAVIVGGRQSLFGPVLGGILVGVVRSGVVWLFGAKWQDAATFLFLIAVVILLPLGLLGGKVRLEAEP